MKQTKLDALVFDVDGTLYKNHKLREGVSALFSEIAKTNIPVIFISGMNTKELVCVVSKIEKEAGARLNKCIIASHMGAHVENYHTSEILLQDLPINAEEIQKIKKVVNHMAPTSILVYRTENQNYQERPYLDDEKFFRGIKNFIGKQFVGGLKSLLEKAKVIELETEKAKIMQLQRLIEDKKVLSVDIITLSRKKKKITSQLNGTTPLSVSNGSLIQLSHTSKLKTLEKICQVCNLNVDNIAYFGDSANDIECLKRAKVAFATNSTNEEVLKMAIDENLSGKMTYITNSLGDINVIECVTGNEFDEKKLREDTYEIAKEQKIYYVEHTKTKHK